MAQALCALVLQLAHFVERCRWRGGGAVVATVLTWPGLPKVRAGREPAGAPARGRVVARCTSLWACAERSEWPPAAEWPQNAAACSIVLWCAALHMSHVTWCAKTVQSYIRYASVLGVAQCVRRNGTKGRHFRGIREKTANAVVTNRQEPVSQTGGIVASRSRCYRWHSLSAPASPSQP